jgi:hypothetical protein
MADSSAGHGRAVLPFKSGVFGSLAGFHRARVALPITC